MIFRFDRLALARGITILALAAIVFAGSARAGETEGEKIARHGVGSVPACFSCHGAAAAGNPAAGFPRLAGLPKAYIEHELYAFDSGLRSNALMEANVRGLSPAELEAVATYLASLPPRAAHAPPPAGADLALGRRIAERGNWSEGVPACFRCHGPDGAGVAPTFPPLSGQSALYLSNQIKAWQSGSRKDTPQGLMVNIARRLSPQEIAAVTAWLATLPATQARESTP